MSAKAKQPGPGELEAFVNKLVSRDGGARDELRQIEKNKKRRAYMKERRANKGKGSKPDTGRKMPRDQVMLGVTNKMSNMILQNGACTTCQIRAISGGSCDLAELARAEEQCIHCYRRSRARHPAAEESHRSHTSYLIDKRGRCPQMQEACDRWRNEQAFNTSQRSWSMPVLSSGIEGKEDGERGQSWQKYLTQK